MANVYIARFRVIGIYFDLENFLVLEPGIGQPVTIFDVLTALKNKTIERISTTKGNYENFDFSNNPDATGLGFVQVENPRPSRKPAPTPDGIYRIEDNTEIPATPRPAKLVWQWYKFGRNPIQGQLGIPESQDGVFNNIDSTAAILRDGESVIIRPVAIILPRISSDGDDDG